MLSSFSPSPRRPRSHALHCVRAKRTRQLGAVSRQLLRNYYGVRDNYYGVRAECGMVLFQPVAVPLCLGLGEFSGFPKNLGSDSLRLR